MRVSLMTAFAIAVGIAGSVWPQQGRAETLSAVLGEEYGAYVVGPDGLPVYAFLTSVAMGGDGEDPLDSCNAEACRQHWRLVTVDGEVRGWTRIWWKPVDGETLLLYGGHPLFQFYRDAPGEPPQGQAIYSYGGYWALVTPVGGTIRTGPMDEVDQLPVAPQD